MGGIQNNLLWFLAVVGIYYAFLLWRGKFALSTIEKNHESFKTSEYLERNENELPRSLKRLILKNQPDLDALGYKRFTMRTNLKFMGGENFHVLYISSDRRKILTFTYMKMPYSARVMSLLTGYIKDFLIPGMLMKTLEVRFTDGTALCSTELKIDLSGNYPRPAPFLRWVLNDQDTQLLKMEEKHNSAFKEFCQGKEEIVVESVTHYQELSEASRKRLAEWQELDLKNFIAENNLEFIASRKD